MNLINQLKKNNLPFIRKNFVIITLIISASILTWIYYLTFSERISLPYNFKLNEYSNKTIIAPFNFTIYKPKEMLEKEQKEKLEHTISIYKVSDNIKFNTQKNIDYIFEIFAKHNNLPALEIKKILDSQAFNLPLSSIYYLKNINNKEKIYNILLNGLDKVMSIGIFDEKIILEKSIYIKKGEEYVNYSLKRLYNLNEAKNYLINNGYSEKAKNVLKNLVDLVLVSNIVIDEEESEKYREKEKKEISPIFKEVYKNEEIIKENRKITKDKLIILQALTKEIYKKKIGLEKKILNYFLYFILFLGELISLTLIIKKRFSKYYNNKNIFIIIACLISFIISLVLINKTISFSVYLVPYCLTLLIISEIYDEYLALSINFYQFILMSQFLNWSIIIPLIFAISSSIFLAFSQKNKYKYFFVYIFFTIIISFLRNDDLLNLSKNIVYISISCLISVFGAKYFIEIFEKFLRILNKKTLYNYLDFENPLLKQLAFSASGTYHHSLMVASIAETLAQAIGANTFLVRVASYYHDIGKIENSDYFIENNINSKNYYKNLTLVQAAQKIKEHVANGIELAKKHNLPQEVIDIISQHHGTMAISYFWNIEKNKETADKKDYFYEGPKPQSKEAVLVMIADIMESKSKSFSNNHSNNLKNVAENTLKFLINHGQFDESPITFADISIIKKNLLSILKGLTHKRIKYKK